MMNIYKKGILENPTFKNIVELIDRGYFVVYIYATSRAVKVETELINNRKIDTIKECVSNAAKEDGFFVYFSNKMDEEEGDDDGENESDGSGEESEDSGQE